MIAPLIILIALLILFSIKRITELIADFTAPPIALPILVPSEEKVFLIFPHSPLKKLGSLLKTFFIAVYAALNFDLKNVGTDAKKFLIDFQAFEAVVVIPFHKLSQNVLKLSQLLLNDAPFSYHRSTKLPLEVHSELFSDYYSLFIK